MDFRILGPLEVHSDLGAIDVPGTKRRAVLAVLLLQANEAVSAERIAAALWGEDAPAGAVKTVQVHVSRLRKALGNEDVLETTPAGYRLHVEPGELDAERFERMVEDGRAALAAGRPEEAGAVLRKALAVWRGPPLADLAFEPFAQVEIARLDEQRQAAIEARVEADLAAGRHAELVAELRRLVAKHPARERLAAHLMLALYRCGRQSEALEAYGEARHRLAEEVGVEPGDELRALQEAILHHDPALAMASAEALPHELDVTSAPPLLGRGSELRWLRDRWDEARAGTGRLVVLAGGQGMGKTRLVAELAAHAHAHGATVLYASGDGPARAVHEVLDRAGGASRPLLLVVDAADEAGEGVLAAVREASGGSTLVVAVATVPEALESLEPGGLLHLKRLDSSAVGEIAALYAPDSATQDVPAEWLLGASGGVPRRVHDVASLWARRETARRIGAVAGRTAAGRSQLRSMEAELAGGVVQLQGTHEWREGGGDGQQQVVCPFKGLAAFEAADAPYFFGRERLVAELVARLVGAPLLSVVGPSGSGKSSAVRAGLLPALASGVLPGSQDWPQRLIRPGEHPMRQLDRAIDGIEGDRFVLAVDQLEEVFTTCRDESERVAFFSELVGAAGDDAGGVVVLAVRADFYGRCASYPALSRLLASNHVLVGPMQQDELERAIVCPASRVGLTVEDDLVDAIVDDVEEAPGALPLLSTALLELWQHREGRRLQLASYERTGGVRGAVARLAEEAFGDLDESRQALARHVLLQLVEVDDEGTVERHRRRLAELSTDEDVEGLLEVLADRRLITVSEGTVELAHEALLREWPRLRGWIDDDREGLRIERSLRSGAREWLRVGKDDGALYRGARLAEASDWTSRNGHALPDLERDFLHASAERAGHDHRTRRRRLAFVFGALTLGLVAIAIVAAVAIHQRRDADRQRNLALSRALAVQSAQTLNTDPELSLRLALWADETRPTAQSAAALRQSTAAFRQLAKLPADSIAADTAAYSPDGKRVVTGGDSGVARVWDPAAQRVLARLPGGHDKLLSARYSPRGDRLALGFSDGTVLVTDTLLREPRAVLRVKDVEINRVTFSADGTRVVAAGADGTVHVAGVEDKRLDSTLKTGDAAILGVDIDAAGRVVTADEGGAVKLWGAHGSGPTVLRKAGDPERDVDFSADDRLVLAVGEDHVARLWNAETGRSVAEVLTGPRKLASGAFSRDGLRFATASYDGAVRVWTTDGQSELFELRGHLSRVLDVGFGRTSDRLVSAGSDGSARIWDASGMQAFHGPADLTNADISPSGRWVATGGWDGDVRVWDPRSGALRRMLPGPGEYTPAYFSDVSDELAVGRDATSSVLRWRPTDPRPRLVDRLPPGSGINVAEFDRTGRRFVYADYAHGTIMIRDLRSGRTWRLRGGPGYVVDVQASPDGRQAVAAGKDGVLYVWDLSQPARPVRRLGGHAGHVNTLDYSADGRIVTAGGDRTARVWNPSSGRQLVILRGHTDEVNTALFTSDGARVLTASADGTARLWDARSGESLVTLQSTPDVPLYDVSEGPGGMIATLDDHQVVRIFRCTVCGSIDQVRGAARALGPRELTAEERGRFSAGLR